MTPAERVAALEKAIVRHYGGAVGKPYIVIPVEQAEYFLRVAKAAVAWREATLAGMLVREAENALLAAIEGTTKEAP